MGAIVRSWTGTFSRYALLAVLTVLFCGPVLWACMASLSTNNQITLNSLTPSLNLHFQNYVKAWTLANIKVLALNSLFISISVALVVTVCAIGLGYALARLPLPGKSLVIRLLYLAIGIPVYVYVVQLSGLLRSFDLVNSRIGVIIATAATFMPIPVLLLRAFFRTIPAELSDSARVDGAGEWTVFLRIMVPLARAGILTSLIFAFVWSWNDLLLPVVLLQTPDKFTIPYGISGLKPQDFRQDYVSIFAASIMSTVPMIIAYLVIQKRFIAGIVMSGVKG